MGTKEHQNKCKHDDNYCPQIMSWSLQGVNVLSAVRGKYRAYRWMDDFLLVSDKET
jgi:hypothetical protein